MDELSAARTALAAWRSVAGTVEPDPMPLVNNPIWSIRTDDGRRFVLKQLPEYAPGCGPVDQFRVMCHLQAHGVPVALPVVTDEGSIHTPVGDRFYALIPYLPNDPANHELAPDAPAVAHAIGATIGQADKALATCPWQVDSYSDNPAHDILVESLPKLPAEVTDRVQPFVDRLSAATKDLPAQRTIGDCNSGNVLVHDKRVSGFIDLDHLPIGPRVRDLSDYLASRLHDHLAADSAERDVAAMLAVLGDYVAGYHDTYPLTDYERNAVVPLMLLIEVGLAGWFLYSWVPHPARYERSKRAIDWITQHFDELLAAAVLRP